MDVPVLIEVRTDVAPVSAVTRQKPIYLDHHATTPVDPRVAMIVLHAMTDVFGNANSVDHGFGGAAAHLVATAPAAARSG
jgi:cysteine desulfurase